MAFGSGLPDLDRIIRTFQRVKSIGQSAGPSAISALSIFELIAFGVTVTVHLIIKISQTPINKILDSGLSSLYVLTTRGDVRVLSRADIQLRLGPRSIDKEALKFSCQRGDPSRKSDFRVTYVTFSITFVCRVRAV
jgi:hypothetical protein